MSHPIPAVDSSGFTFFVAIYNTSTHNIGKRTQSEDMDWQDTVILFSSVFEPFHIFTIMYLISCLAV